MLWTLWIEENQRNKREYEPQSFWASRRHLCFFFEDDFLLPLVSMFRSNAFAMAAKLSLEKVQSVPAAKAGNVPKVHERSCMKRFIF